MDYRRWATCLEWLFAAAVVSAHLAAICLAPRLAQDGVSGMLISAVPHCQLVLLLAWAVLGPGRAIGRVWFAPALLFGGGLAWAWMWHERASGMIRMESLLLALTGLTSGCLLLIARLGGLAMRHRPRDGEAGAQYSLRSLLGLTTLIAIAIGVLERLRPLLAEHPGDAATDAYVGLSGEMIPDLSLPQLTRLLVLAVSIAGVSLAATWTILRPGNPWIRVLATSLATASLGAYLSHLTSSTAAPLFGLANQLLVLLALVGGSVVPLRLMQFRLMRTAAAALPSRSSATQHNTSLLAESTP